MFVRRGVHPSINPSSENPRARINAQLKTGDNKMMEELRKQQSDRYSFFFFFLLLPIIPNFRSYVDSDNAVDKVINEALSLYKIFL